MIEELIYAKRDNFQYFKCMYYIYKYKTSFSGEKYNIFIYFLDFFKIKFDIKEVKLLKSYVFHPHTLES